jgi:hypothetical protein
MSRTIRHGLTKIEVLAVIAVVGLVVGMLLPAQRRIRGSSDRMRCVNNLKIIMLGIHAYESTTPSTVSPGGGSSTDSIYPTGCMAGNGPPEERLSWMVAILPFIEENNLYEKLDLAAGTGGNQHHLKRRIGIYQCPSAGGLPGSESGTTYAAMSGVDFNSAHQPKGTVGNGFMGYSRITNEYDICDGSSNTIAILETNDRIAPWAHGGPATVQSLAPGMIHTDQPGRRFGRHSTTIPAAYADGTVRNVHARTEPAIFAAAVTIAGGESIAEE